MLGVRLNSEVGWANDEELEMNGERWRGRRNGRGCKGGRRSGWNMHYGAVK